MVIQSIVFEIGIDKYGRQKHNIDCGSTFVFILSFIYSLLGWETYRINSGWKELYPEIGPNTSLIFIYSGESFV